MKDRCLRRTLLQEYFTWHLAPGTWHLAKWFVVLTGGGIDCPPTLSRPAKQIRLGETSHIPYLLLKRENMQITN